MYKAKVVKLQVKPHPNADRLQLGYVNGIQVIVGMDTHDGDVGVFFPVDGQLSDEFLRLHNLYRHSENNVDTNKRGYFSDNGRVTCEKIRGQRSDGFWCPLSYFEYTGYDLSKLNLGDEFDELNGHKICQKYYTPATKTAMSKRVKKPKKVDYNFPKHFDTDKLEYNLNKIEGGDTVIITEKLHGTSTRIGYVQVERENNLTWWQKLYNKLPFPNYPEATKGFEFTVGTRNTIASDWVTENSSEWYRIELAKQIEGMLKKGEIVYAEIVGYDSNGGLIMNAQNTSKLPELQERFGDKMMYRYGCRWNEVGIPQNKMYVYRITQVNEDGYAIDLSWAQVKKRARELGLEAVPELFKFEVEPGTLPNAITKLVQAFVKGQSYLDDTHIREGVCLRVEKTNGDTVVLKHKSFEFKVLEGILKQNDDYVDREEIS
jgi:hypothetical protein